MKSKKYIMTFIVSFGRMCFYYLVVYGSLICGSSTFSEESLLDLRSLLIATLFMPFVFIYSMLFEFANHELFDKKLKVKEAIIQYLHPDGKYFYSGWISIVVTLLFIYSLSISIKSGFLPLGFYPIVLTTHFVSAGLLFASKYHQILKFRTEIEDGVQSLFKVKLFILTLILYPIALVYIGKSGLSVPQQEQVEYDKLLSYALYIYFGSIVSILVGQLLNRGKTASDMFTFENPFIREPILLFSILWIPFISGVYSSYTINGIKIEFSELISLVFFTPRYFSVLMIATGLMLVLELMRYLGRYDQSFHYRSVLKSHDSKNEVFMESINKRFKKSVQNYSIIFLLVLSFSPIMFLLGEFQPSLNFILMPFVYLMILAVMLILRPYNEMGYLNAQAHPFKLTRSRELIGLKIIGFIILLTVMHYAYQTKQQYPFYIQRTDGNVVLISNKYQYTTDVKTAKEFIDARESSDYKKKRDIALKMCIAKYGTGIVDSSAFDLFKALRFTPYDWLEFIKEKTTIKNEFNLDLSKVIKYYHDILDGKDSETGYYFILGLFFTLVVSFLVWYITVTTNNVNEPNLSVIGVTLGVLFQFSIVGLNSVAFFQELDAHISTNDFSRIIFNLLTSLQYGRNSLTIGGTYVGFAFGLLLLLAFDRILRSRQEGEK